MPSVHPLLFRGARLFDGERFHDDLDLRVGSDGRIAEIGSALQERPGEQLIDATGKTLMPGLVDCHVHFREPGLVRKEGYATGSAGALHGGVTTVCEIQNNPPLMESASLLQSKLLSLRGVSRVDYAPYGSLTMDSLPHLEGLVGLCPAVKCFLGCSTGAGGVRTEGEMRALFAGAAEVGLRIVAHCENNAILDRASRELEGADATRHDLRRPREAEVQSIRDAIRVATEVGAVLHVFHISTAEGGRLVAAAADEGLPVTGSTAPHYLLVDAEEAAAATQNRFKVNPSIKYDEDRVGLAQLVAEGKICAVGTDHAPHPLDEKDRPYDKAPSGFPSIDLLLPLMFAIADLHGMDEASVLRSVTAGPAEEFELHGKGRLAVGADADLVLLDPTEVRTVEESTLPSKSKWSPYHGRELRGFPQSVWLRGHCVHGEDAVESVIGEALFSEQARRSAFA